MSKNAKLNRARKNKCDEFYTFYETIQEELQHYHSILKDKIVYCPCDDKNSNFFKYFLDNFDVIGIKKLFCSGIPTDKSNDPKLFIATSKNDIQEINLSNGSIFDDELKPYLQECDIIVTNPPFSLSRKIYDLIKEYDKMFILITNIIFYCYTKQLKDFAARKLKFGVNNIKCQPFKTPYSNEICNVQITWVHNTPLNFPPKKYWELNCKYNPSFHKHFDNDATILNVDSCKFIPIDYPGKIGVPLTFCYKMNFDEWEVLPNPIADSVNGVNKFRRIAIINKKLQK